MRVLVTGGAGFIGSAVVRQLICQTSAEVVNVDKLTYAGSLDTVADIADNPRYAFRALDVCDETSMGKLFAEFMPTAVIHLAAESHVDRSIDHPSEFIRTNVVGAFTLLETAQKYWRGSPASIRDGFRFIQVSTDEVFGNLSGPGHFDEQSPYRPNSPYAASKAGADHLVRAWGHTYGLPTIVTNCTNNYGPFQFPEKLIPVTILSAIAGKPLPIYGQGSNIRDWLHVEDHTRALRLLLEGGRDGEAYAIGGRNERSNIEMVNQICTIIDELAPDSPYAPHASLITFVPDRPGHDFRYAIDPSKIETELGWKACIPFTVGLRQTVAWYLENRDWCSRMLRGRSVCERRGLA